MELEQRMQGGTGTQNQEPLQTEFRKIQDQMVGVQQRTLEIERRIQQGGTGTYQGQWGEKEGNRNSNRFLQDKMLVPKPYHDQEGWNQWDADAKAYMDNKL